ncbi:uncharacterized protein LOC144750544 [Ciona intestinalis]
MDKQLLRPKELNVDPEAPNAARHFTYWLRTVTDFIEHLDEGRAAVSAANKRRVIVNCLSADIFSYVEEAETYDAIVTTLKRIYVKRKNNVFARYLLVSRHQKPDESISEYLRELRELAKECSFSDVTADRYKEELTRDAFINGLKSPDIRQRLLEIEDLNLGRASELAENLDKAKRQTMLMGPTMSPLASVQQKGDFDSAGVDNEVGHDRRLAFVKQARNLQSNEPKPCHFCGGRLHRSRSTCPALDSVCYNCGKTGHFSRVCRFSRGRRTPSKHFSASAMSPSDSPISTLMLLASAPSCLGPALVDAALESVPVKVLVDSGASENFINSSLVDKLSLSTSGPRLPISMASSHLLRIPSKT